MSALKIQLDVQTEETPARQYGCGHCNLNAMVESNGVLVVKNRHNAETHANAFMVSSLIKDYVSRAGTQQLNEIQQALEKRRAAIVGLGLARPRQNGGDRLR